MNEEIVIVAGPTASGKSGLAVALAEELRGTIVNADSMQVYRDLPILTAQPDAATQARVPHRVYGEVDAALRHSAGAWRERAVAEIDAARTAGRVPILVGGTGLYLRSLLQGLAPTPPIPPAVSEEARALHAAIGPAAFHERLRSFDPDAAARLNPGDTQRVLRAYEVAIASGSALSDWQRQHVQGLRYSAAVIVLAPAREALYPACNARFRDMVEHGAIAEVEALMARNLDPSLPAMRALGLRPLADYGRGRTSRETAIAAAQQATRNYAKRQMTWFRHQIPEQAGLRKLVVSEKFSERLLPNIFSFIRH